MSNQAYNATGANADAPSLLPITPEPSGIPPRSKPVTTATGEEPNLDVPGFDGRWLNISDEGLLDWYAEAQERVELTKATMGRLEQEIQRRIKDRGATGIPDETFECEVKIDYTYDQGLLTPLLEVLNTVELEKCYQPAYTPEPEEVPAKWKVQQLLAVARRRGTEALAIVERARFESGRRLKFERREVP